MADTFKRQMGKRIGYGGIRCSCCNDYMGKKKPRLRRIARRTLKLADQRKNP